MQHFATVPDFTPQQIQDILDLSAKLQANPKEHQQDLATKNILFCFEKPSLRTLVGTESAINQLGGSVIHTTPEAFLGGKIIHAGDLDLGERETLKDTVKNVEKFCDAIFTRVFSHDTITNLTGLSDIPVVNALCDQHHPCQAMADMLTLQQHFGKDKKLNVLFVGDGNNVAFSLGQILLMLGHNFSWCGPDAYSFTESEISSLKKLEAQYGGKLTLTNNPDEVIVVTNAVYTDAWVSMGEETEYKEKNAAFAAYQVNKNMMEQAPKHAIFMHCLPAHRGYEVTNDVIDSSQSVVYEQAKNRMVTAKGIFHYLLTNK